MSGYIVHLMSYLVIVIVGLTLAQHYLSPDLSVVKTLAGVAIGAMYCLLPDIDTPSSKMRRIVGRIFLAIILVSMIIYLTRNLVELIYLSIILVFSLYILWFVKHRGALHTPVVGLILSAPLYAIEPWYAGFAFLGFMSHLVLDKEVFH